MTANSDTLKRDLVRAELRLTRANVARAQWRERAIAAEQVVAFYCGGTALPRPALASATSIGGGIGRCDVCGEHLLEDERHLHAEGAT